MDLLRKRGVKKRFLLPFILIIFLLIPLVVNGIKKLDFNFVVLPSQEVISPLSSPTPEENLKAMLSQYGLIPKKLNFWEKEIEASFSGELGVLFSLEKDLASQVVSLHFILSRSKIEGKLPKLIDLRFNKPTVLY